MVVREAHVHRGGNDFGVARHKVEHLRERARRHDGEPQTVKRRHLHLLTAAHADERIVRFTEELLPEAAHLRGGIARARHAQERPVEPRLFQKRFGFDPVAAHRLANGPHPGRQNAVAHGEFTQLGFVGQGQKLFPLFVQHLSPLSHTIQCERGPHRRPSTGPLQSLHQEL